MQENLEKYNSLSAKETKKAYIESLKDKCDENTLIFYYYLSLYEKDPDLKQLSSRFLSTCKEKMILEGANVDSLLKTFWFKWEFERYMNATKKEKIAILKKFSQGKSPIIFKNLLSLLNKEKDITLLSVILQLLAYHGESKAIPILTKGLNLDNKELKIAIIKAFTYLKQIDISEYLEDYIFSEDIDLSLEACKALWNLKPFVTRKRIQELLQATDDEKVKIKIINKLEEIATLDAKNIIFKLSDDPKVGEYAQKVTARMKIKFDFTQKMELKIDVDTIEGDLYSQIEEETNVEIGLKKLELLYEKATLDDYNFCLQFLEKTTNEFYISSLTKNLPRIAKRFGREDELREKLYKYLSSSDDRVRANTVEGLTFLADAKTISIFLDMLQRDESPRVFGILSKFLLPLASDKVEEMIKEKVSQGIVWKNAFLSLVNNDIEYFSKYPFIKELIENFTENNNPEIVQKAKAILYAWKEKKAISSSEVDVSIIDKIIEEGIPDDIVEKQFELLESTDDVEIKIKTLHFLSSLICTESHFAKFKKIFFRMIASEEDEKIISTLIIVGGRVLGKEVIPYIKPLLQHQSPRVRANTIEILGELLEDDEELENLLSPYLSDTNSRVVVNTIILLEKKNPAKAKVKLDELFSSSKPEDINSAIFAVRTLKKQEYIGKLKDLTQHKDNKISFHASYALMELEKGFVSKKVATGSLSLEDKIHQLLDFFQYGDMLSRKLAIDELQKVIQKEGEKTIPIVEKILSSSSNDYVLSLLVKLLGFTNSEKIIPIIEKFLKHENSRVRANAIEGLNMLMTPRIKELLERQLSGETDSRVLNNVIIGLSKFSKDEAREVMESLKRRGLLEDAHLNFLEKALKKDPQESQTKTSAPRISRHKTDSPKKVATKKDSRASVANLKKPPKTAKEKRKKSGFAIAGIIILLIGGGIFYYWKNYHKTSSLNLSKFQQLVKDKKYSAIVLLLEKVPLEKLNSKLAYLKVWALMKLKKYEEASLFLQKLPEKIKNEQLLKMEKLLGEIQSISREKKDIRAQDLLSILPEPSQRPSKPYDSLLKYYVNKYKLSHFKIKFQSDSPAKDLLKKLLSEKMSASDYGWIKKNFSSLKEDFYYNYLLSLLFLSKSNYKKALVFALKTLRGEIDSLKEFDALENLADILLALGKIKDSSFLYHYLAQNSKKILPLLKYNFAKEFLKNLDKDSYLQKFAFQDLKSERIKDIGKEEKGKLKFFISHIPYKKEAQSYFSKLFPDLFKKAEKKEVTKPEKPIVSAKSEKDESKVEASASLKTLLESEEDIFNIYTDQ